MGCGLQIAIAIDSRNPLARFEAAGVLASLERHEEALVQLKQLTVSTAAAVPSTPLLS